MQVGLNINPIIVIGAGSWGTALALTLAKNGSDVRLWAHFPEHRLNLQRDRENATFLPGYPFPDNIEVINAFPNLFENAEPEAFQDILIVVPSMAFEDTLVAIKPYLNKKSRILCASKGLTSKGELLHTAFMRLIAPDFPEVPFGVISGPSFAKEVAAGLPTAISCATTDERFTQDMQQRFHSPYFRVYTSSDITGLELGGVVKNVLAIATGISDGLNLGANAKSALITRGLSELKGLYLALGARLETLIGLSGVGDLILSCTDNQSRNRRFGLSLGQGLTPSEAESAIGQTVEGKRGAEIVLKLFEQHQLPCPICECVAKIITQKLSAREALNELLLRPARKED